jgi:hypothetical protein
MQPKEALPGGTMERERDPIPARAESPGKDFAGLATPGEMDISIWSAHDDKPGIAVVHNVTAR